MWDRRAIAFQRECYLHGLPASAAYNSRRTNSSQAIISPFDFIARSAEENQHDEIILMLRSELSSIPPEHIPAARQKWFETLTKNGVPDVEGILLEVFEAFGG